MGQLRVDAMSADELPDFLALQLNGYIQQRVEFGGEDRAGATRVAEEQFAEYFPGGTPAEGHHLFVGRDADTGARVGILWLFDGAVSAASSVFIYDIEVDDAARGRGWGRALMEYVKSFAMDRHAVRIELNVFGGNLIARNLYRSLGYSESSVHMAKHLTGHEPQSETGHEPQSETDSEAVEAS